MTLAISDLPSPNHDARDGPVSFLILHYTGMQSAAAAVARLRDPGPRVSSHYVVDEDGSVLRLVPEERRAWHAGVSYWGGRRGLNEGSIGVEIVNPGHEWGYRPFPAPQIDAVMALCRAILARHPIPARHVLGHSDIAPDRKQDPGELFPWRRLAEAGIGFWPESAAGGSDADPRKALEAIGYDVSMPLPVLVTAFQRHWRPESVTGAIDDGTRAMLGSVAAG